MRAGPGFILFARAEQLSMTVAKLLTGKDLPLGNIEMALNNTYGLAKHMLEKQQGKKR